MGYEINDYFKIITEFKNANKIEIGAAIVYEEAAALNGQVYMTCQSLVKDECILDYGFIFHMTPFKLDISFS